MLNQNLQHALRNYVITAIDPNAIETTWSDGSPALKTSDTKLQVSLAKGSFNSFGSKYFPENSSGDFNDFLELTGQTETELLEAYGSIPNQSPSTSPSVAPSKKSPDEFRRIWDSYSCVVPESPSEAFLRVNRRIYGAHSQHWLKQDFKGQLVLPLVDADRRITGLEVRRIDGVEPKSHVFSGSVCSGSFFGDPLQPLDYSKPILIGEGFTDYVCLKVNFPEYQVIALKSASTLPVLGDCSSTPIVFMADDDSKGIEAAEKLAGAVPHLKVIWPKTISDDYAKYKDVSDIYLNTGYSERTDVTKKIKKHLLKLFESSRREAVDAKNAILSAAKDISLLNQDFAVCDGDIYKIMPNKVCIEGPEVDREIEQIIYHANPQLSRGKRLEKIQDWKFNGNQIPPPSPFAFLSEDKLCLQRTLWDPSPGPHPAWDEFLTRLSSPEPFKAWVWSCFEAQNKSRQILWLFGRNGQDGKSCVMQTLYGVFGVAATAVDSSTFDSKDTFGLSHLYGKRFAVDFDCRNPRILMYGNLRKCTSGKDTVIINKKNRPKFTAQVYLKVAIVSNDIPAITSGGADTSRLLGVEVFESKTKDDPTWESKLQAELPHFLWSCQKAYQTLCAHHGDIALDAASKEFTGESSSAFEEKYLMDFENHFEADPKSKLKAQDVRQVTEFLGYKQTEHKDFKDWLVRYGKTRGITFDRKEAGTFWFGFKVKVSK